MAQPARPPRFVLMVASPTGGGNAMPAQVPPARPKQGQAAVVVLRRDSSRQKRRPSPVVRYIRSRTDEYSRHCRAALAALAGQARDTVTYGRRTPSQGVSDASSGHGRKQRAGRRWARPTHGFISQRNQGCFPYALLRSPRLQRLRGCTAVALHTLPYPPFRKHEKGKPDGQTGVAL